MNNLYEQAMAFLDGQMGKGQPIVLATSADDMVTARTVSVAPKGDKYYFATFDYSNKFAQIKANKNVAFCFDGVQITGVATVIGPLSEHRAHEGAAAISEGFGEWYEEYCHAPGCVLIEVQLKSVICFDDSQKPPIGYDVDCINHTAKLLTE